MFSNILSKATKTQRTLRNSKKHKTNKNCYLSIKKHGVEWIPPVWDMEKMEWKEGAIWRE